MTKHIVIFGCLIKAQEYSRSFILCKAFEDLGCRLTFCTASTGLTHSGISPMLKIIDAILNAPFRWVHLICKYLFLPDHDLVYIPYPAHTDAWIACILAKLKHRPIILDDFFGLYDTIVRDRELFTPKSLIARLVWNYEKRLLESATCVLVDTQEHVLMLENDYQLPGCRFKAIPVGIDESLWVPTAFPSEKAFRVVYWGTFIPLHGAEVVAHAAKLLETQFPEIQILVIGKGQEENKFKEIIEKSKPVNLKWIKRFIPLQEIQKFVEQSHCCLGIFGKQEKAQRAIPYKAYQALASCKAFITGRTRASNALFADGINALLVNPGDPVGLSLAMQRLATDRTLAMSIGKNGRRLYEARLSNAVIREQLARAVESVVR
jgi:glycosyltransferase involved in cell wall biosynthesis